MFKAILMDGTELGFHGQCNKVSDTVKGCLAFQHYGDNNSKFITLEIIPLAMVKRVINTKAEKYIRELNTTS